MTLIAQIEECARVADYERAEYEKSAREFDKLGQTTMGTNELRCAVAAGSISDQIAKLKGDAS